MKVSVLASGSAGNAALFESLGTRVLVDAGIGPRTLAQRIAEVGAGGLPQAIVVTHAHGDHVQHCAKIAKKLRIPVYASEATARAAHLGGEAAVRVFSSREAFVFGALTIAPLPIPHDAAQVSLVVSDGESSVGLATDLGEVPPSLPGHLAACDVVLLESNHDPELLRTGPYPDFLKRRIASARGHLSNEQSCELLAALPPRTHTVVLMHLSETNNRADIALGLAKEALSGRMIRLVAATQRTALAVDARAPSATPSQLPLFH